MSNIKSLSLDKQQEIIDAIRESDLPNEIADNLERVLNGQPSEPPKLFKDLSSEMQALFLDAISRSAYTPQQFGIAID